MKVLRVLGLLLALALWVAVGWLGTGCSAVESAIPVGDTSACERAKPANVECATVYQCARGVDGEPIELCIRAEDLQAAELANGPCWPSRDERFDPYADLGVDPPCFWCCEGECGRGANAHNGVFCP